MKCNYRYCEAELPVGSHGLLRYCDEYCSHAERLEREKEKYEQRKLALLELKRIEALLRICYNRYGTNAFDINILREMSMEWRFFSSTTTIDGIEFRTIGSYGYVAFDNNTIKIVKL